MPDDKPDPKDRFRLTPEQWKEVTADVRDMIAKGYIVPAPEPEPEPIRPPLRQPDDPAEYMDANRFPVTTREGMTLAEQMAEDECWLRELREYLEEDGKLTPRKRAELVELLYKVPVQHRIRELASGRPGQSSVG